MNAVLKLLIVAAILNAAARAGYAAVRYYELKDETEQLIRFGTTQTSSQLHEKIVAKAKELNLPVEAEGADVHRDGVRTIARVAYTQPIEERYAHFLTPPPITDGPRHMDDLREEYGPVTVPAGQYFMMGDNRDNSQDSRYWGFMPRDYVKGKALFVYFSYGDTPEGSTSVRWARILHQIH